MNGKITLKELSVLSGVSIATASRALKNPEIVTEKTRVKIQTALDGLQKKRTNIIAFVIPDITNQFFPLLLKGIEEIARVQGFSLMLCNSEGNPANEDKILTNLLKIGVDGILFICSGSPTEFLKSIITNKTVPIVFLDRNPGLKGIISVSSNNFEGMYQSASYLISLGHRQILYLGGPKGVSTEEERYRGFCSALESNHISLSDTYRYEGNYQSDGAYQITRQFLNKDPKRFTAICASNDLMAFGAYQAVVEGHYSIPNDYSLIGYDDIPPSSLLQLTTIKQPFEEMGRTAMLQLLTLIGDSATPLHSLMLSNGIVIRKSCCFVKRESSNVLK